MVLRSDPARARALLGWEASTSLEAGIRATADWMRGRNDRSETDRVQI